MANNLGCCLRMNGSLLAPLLLIEGWSIQKDRLVGGFKWRAVRTDGFKWTYSLPRNIIAKLFRFVNVGSVIALSERIPHGVVLIHHRLRSTDVVTASKAMSYSSPSSSNADRCNIPIQPSAPRSTLFGE